MAIAVGQTSKGRVTGFATAATTGVATQASGSTFVVGIIWNATPTFTSLVDSKGNTYTLIGTERTFTSGDKTRFYYCENGIGGASHTATVTVNDTTTITVLFLEITGGLTSGILDVSNAGTDDSSPYVSQSITTTQAAELLVAFFAGQSGSNPATHANSSSFTIQSAANETDGSQYWTGCLATRIVSSTSSYTSSFTETGGSQSAIHIAGFKEAGGGGGSTAIKKVIQLQC